MYRGFLPQSQIISKPPQLRVPQCGQCGLFKTCNSPKMPVSGDGGSRVLIIGEAPGKEEDNQNRQFVGKTGQRLRRVLREIGVRPDDDCWFSNAAICRPEDNAEPTDDEIEYCRPNLINTVEDLKPHVIILLGKVAQKACIGWLWRNDLPPSLSIAGAKIPNREPNVWLCPTFHPSFVERADDKDEQLNRLWEEHLKAAFDLSGRPWETIPDERKQIERLTDVDRASEIILDFMDAGDAIAFDYETNMVKPDGPDARIISCAVSNGRRAIAFPWLGRAIKAMKLLLLSPCPKIAANIKFEHGWTMTQLGIEVAGWYWDTMNGQHVIDYREYTTSLKWQAYARYGMPSYDDHIKPLMESKGGKKVNQILKEVDLMDLLLYNGLDALLEYQLGRDQMPEINYPLPKGMQ